MYFTMYFFIYYYTISNSNTPPQSMGSMEAPQSYNVYNFSLIIKDRTAISKSFGELNPNLYLNFNVKTT